jgi:hypothetical protein
MFIPFPRWLKFTLAAVASVVSAAQPLVVANSGAVAGAAPAPDAAWGAST